MADAIVGCAKDGTFAKIIASKLGDFHRHAASDVGDLVHKDTGCTGVLTSLNCHAHFLQFLIVRH